MRWDNLFHDLEAQLESEGEFAQADVDRDERRRRRAEESLLQTLENVRSRDASARPVELWTEHERLWITVDNSGRDWISGEITSPAALAGYAVLSVSSIRAVRVSAESSSADDRDSEKPTDETPPKSQRARPQGHRALITLRIVLRDLARRRKTGFLHTPQLSVHGRLDRVGADFVEIRVSPGYEDAPQTAERQGFYIPLESVEFFRLDD